MSKADRLNKEIDILFKIAIALFTVFIYVALYKYNLNQLLIVAPIAVTGATLATLRILKDLKELEDE